MQEALIERTQDKSRVYLTSFLFLSYITGSLILAYFHRYTYVTKTLIFTTFFLLAFLMRDSKEFIKDWAPLMAATFLLDACRGFIYGATLFFKLPIHSEYVIKLEQMLTQSQVMPIILQHAVLHSPFEVFFRSMFAIVYGFHFLYFLLVGLLIWNTRRPEFWRYKTAFLTIMSLGMFFYAIIPTTPPWLAAQNNLLPPIEPTVFSMFNSYSPTLFETFNINPVGAMPSLHVAFATLCLLIGFHHYRWRAWPMIVYSILLDFTCVASGMHYMVDVIAGTIFALLPFYLSYKTKIFARFERGSSSIYSSLFVAVLILIIMQLTSMTNLYFLLQTKTVS